MSSLIYKLLNRRGVVFYLLFNIYLIFIHPGLITQLSEVSLSNPNPTIGWILLLLPVLEILGFWLKYPILRSYARTNPHGPSNWSIILIIFLPIFHLGMSAFLYIVGVQISGLQPNGDTAWYWQVLFVVGFFLIIIKEMGFLLLFFMCWGMQWTGNQYYPPNILFLKRLRINTQKIQLKNLLEDTLGDFLLLVFSSLGYTALWEYTGMTSPFYTHVGFWRYFTQLIGVLIFFMMVIPPLQVVYLLHESLIRTTKGQKLWSGFQYLMTLITAVFSIIRS